MSSKNTKYLLLSLILGAALFSSACSISLNGPQTTTSGTTSNGGGVWVSGDRGMNWRQMSQIQGISYPVKNFDKAEITSISADPQDSAAVYLGTANRGLFFTYNVNYGWQQAQSLGQGMIKDLQVDPLNKCHLFAAVTNHLYSSSDCGRSWETLYYDNNPAVSINSIAVDYIHNNNIYLGTSQGDLIRSVDSGQTWRTVQHLPNAVAKIAISTSDNRLVYIATVDNGIYSFLANSVAPGTALSDSDFAVNNWTNLGQVLQDLDIGNNFRDLAISPVDDSLFIATDKTIVRSPDQGITWEKLQLLPLDKGAIINAIAVNPKNSKEVYYVTNTAFFRSLDGGVTWTSKKLPTSQAASKLLIDSANPKIIYLGTKATNNNQ